MKAIGKVACVVMGFAPALAGGPSALATEITFSCTNSASHAVWTVKVDDVRHTADGNPADISAARIAWREPGRGLYDLDRASGVLTYSNASSTGGYILIHQCHAVN